MKKLVLICLVSVLLTTAAAWGAISDTINNTVVSFDENGNGYIDGEPLLFDVDIPPEGIPGHETLFYTLPVNGVVEGDVVIYEDAAQNISDLLRFDIAAPPCVFVYSDVELDELNSELADTGIPDLWRGGAGGVVFFTEEGTENGWNGLHYTPEPGQPGYVTGQNVTYVFTSDVPEPATMALLGLGSLVLLRKRRA
jgi:hypothetical protein